MGVLKSKLNKSPFLTPKSLERAPLRRKPIRMMPKMNMYMTKPSLTVIRIISRSEILQVLPPKLSFTTKTYSYVDLADLKTAQQTRGKTKITTLIRSSVRGKASRTMTNRRASSLASTT